MVRIMHITLFLTSFYLYDSLEIAKAFNRDHGNTIMEELKKTIFPAYRRIAIYIAQDIVGGKYVEGQKLSGRTVLSSRYAVSPETVRKAVHLLKDIGILDVKKAAAP